MDEAKMAEIVGSEVQRAIRAEMRDFYIERETHYQDHQFIKGLRDVFDTSKGEVCKQLANAAVKAIIYLLILGAIAWIVFIRKA
jgi:hypothetical protein